MTILFCTSRLYADYEVTIEGAVAAAQETAILKPEFLKAYPLPNAEPFATFRSNELRANFVLNQEENAL